MKIGILIKDFSELRNWELRIIQEIFNNPKFELSLLIQDGRTGDESLKTLKSKFRRLLKSQNILGKILFKIQTSIERKFFFQDGFTVDREKIIKELTKINTIKVKPKRKEFLDIFDEVDVNEIKKHDLDVILRHEFNISRGSILNASKYGIWSFHDGNNLINNGGSTGFWEIIFKPNAVGITLQQLTPEIDSELVIDKAFFNWHWSFVKTNKLILEASVSLLLKNLNKLVDGNYSVTKSKVNYNPLYKDYKLLYTIKYIFSFYYNLIKKAIERFNEKLLGIRYNCWSLFIGEGDFLNATLSELKSVKLQKGEYWADPFIFNHKGDNYVFFESFSYQKGKGKISCGKIEGKSLTDISDVLDLDYHLSYPFIFEEDGEIYLMPETNESNRLEIYKCINFPNKWELYSTAFEGEKVADAFFYNDDENQKWLFINKQADFYAPMDSELFIYKVDSIKLKEIEPHKQNPVLIDSRIARNGGAVFKYENEYYRPSQANIDGVYGRGLNINKIKKLTIDAYVEEHIKTEKPNFIKGLNSMHHLHQVDGLFVIDAAFNKK